MLCLLFPDRHLLHRCLVLFVRAFEVEAFEILSERSESRDLPTD
jgi:hypothetical protein